MGMNYKTEVWYILLVYAKFIEMSVNLFFLLNKYIK
jgi:hypothetical protein